MQIDMHYYGTYCLARAAGIERRDCQVIASAAQFVDDNAHGDAVKLQCGTKIRVEATAHHPMDWRNLGVPTGREHQEGIWIPFHFLPGNEGEEYEERLLCRQNSKLARKMVDHHLEWQNRKAYRMLVGIAAHVYADTFAHYGFSGIPSHWNEVKLKTLEVENKEVLGESLLDYVTGKLGKLVKEAEDRVKAQIAETASWGLGHGGAATYPDRPYMVWSFEYENTAHGERRGRKARDNPRTFLAGAKALHAMFQRVRETGRV